MTKKVSKESLNPADERLLELKKVIPEVFTEGKIDFDKLQRTLGKDIDGRDEKYSFNWAGRKETFKNIQTTAKGTLKPAEKESVNWDSTENLFIEGDNLEALKLLQKSYYGKIKMIYLDPPYNTGNDFVYKDDFKNSMKAYLEQTGQLNGDGVKLTTNLETNGRYHSDWISMMYSRLFIARNLLREDGVIFVSIDDGELHNLKMIMNEIFGEENVLDRGTLIWENKGSTKGFNKIVKNHEYILAYGKNAELVKSLYGENFPEELGEIEHYCYNAPNPGNPPCEIVFKAGCKIRGVKDKTFNDTVGDEVKLKIVSKKMEFKNGVLVNDVTLRGAFPYRFQIEEFFRNQETGEPTLDYKGQKWEEIYFNSKGLPRYRKSRGTKIISSIIDDKNIPHYGSDDIKKLFGKKEIFPFPKPKELVMHIAKYFISDNDTILDFFAGSGTTAHSIIELNEKTGKGVKYILVQLPEKTDKKSEAFKAGFKTISEIAIERVKRVIKDKEKHQKEKSKQKKLTEDKTAPLDLGFKVFKLDQSNYKIWEKYEGKDEKELKKQLELFKSSLVSGYKEQDVIYECIIKEGYSLNSSIEKISVKTNKVYKVTDGELFFYVCLDQEVKDKTIDELKLKKEDMFICLDEALNDSRKKNLAIQCNLKTI